MSKEQSVGESSHTKAHKSTDTETATTQQQSTASTEQTYPPSTHHSDETSPAAAKPRSTKGTPAAKASQTPETTSPSTPEDHRTHRPRQVIAVSANKGPAAFFNLARKFLVTDEICDLSALEGAIVSAADAAHLLERSKLATIVRVQTSYVNVEPKRRRPLPGSQSMATDVAAGTEMHSPQQQHHPYVAEHADISSYGDPMSGEARLTASGRELRRARIVITVQRTASYKQWLDENPSQSVLAEDDVDEGEADDAMDVAIVEESPQER